MANFDFEFDRYLEEEELGEHLELSLPIDPDEMFYQHTESIEALVKEEEAEALNMEVQQVPKKDLRSSVHLQYHELVTITRKGDQESGALLLSFTAVDYLPSKEYWFPKKLCRNLDTKTKTVWVWDKFLAREHPVLLKEFGE